MSQRAAVTSRLRSAVTLGAVVAVVGLAAALALDDHVLEDDAELAVLFHLRGASAAPRDVVVVAVDPALVAGVEAGYGRASSRRAHAAAVRSLREAGAAVIAFDMQFDTAAGDSASDQAFAAAMRDAGNVVLVESIRRETQPVTASPGRASGSIIIDTPVPPGAVFAAAAQGYGAFQLPRTSRVDAYWAFPSRVDNRVSLPVLAFHVFALAHYAHLESAWRRAAVPGGAPPLPTSDALRALPPAEAIAALRAVISAHPNASARTIAELDRVRREESVPGSNRSARAALSLYGGEPVRYLNYYGPPRTIRTISYETLLAEAAEASSVRLRDKAIFVGYSGSTTSEQDRVRDDYVTVFPDPSGVRLSGVEIAATAFANILDDNEVRRLSDVWRLILVVVWGVALGSVARVLRPASAALAVLLVGGLYLAIAVWIFSATALALPLVVPIGIQALGALLAGTLLGYREARREREVIKHAFGHYLPRSVVDELAKGIGAVRDDNQLVHGAVLATDVEGYSALAETIEPRELARLMDRYFGELFTPVKDRGGTILNVAGDGALAIWTSAASEREFRRRACHALLDMAARVDEFNRRNAGPILRTRMAVHCGQFMLGSFGTAEHLEYRAVGDIVNTATRIEGLNKFLGTWRLASAVTVEGLDEFLGRPVGSFVLAGKSQPLDVWELIGRRGEVDASTVDRCNRFAAALSRYRTGDLRRAITGFREIVDAFPDDGPAAFYLRRCNAMGQQSDTAAAWDPTVHLHAK